MCNAHPEFQLWCHVGLQAATVETIAAEVAAPPSLPQTLPDAPVSAPPAVPDLNQQLPVQLPVIPTPMPPAAAEQPEAAAALDAPVPQAPPAEAPAQAAAAVEEVAEEDPPLAPQSQEEVQPVAPQSQEEVQPFETTTVTEEPAPAATSPGTIHFFVGRRLLWPQSCSLVVQLQRHCHSGHPCRTPSLWESRHQPRRPQRGQGQPDSHAHPLQPPQQAPAHHFPAQNQG